MKMLLAGFMSILIALGGAPVAHAGVNDFTIEEYQIDLYVGRDNDGRSTLRTVEKILANFPAADVNHGIERAIPTSYDGHSTSLKINDVEHENFEMANSALQTNYSTYGSNGNKVVRIGQSDRYVIGRNTYKIDYSQRDVTKYFNESGFEGDEFYWDTNGTEWQVPIENLTVRVHVDDVLRSRMTDSRSCYLGYAGANRRCEISEQGGMFTTSASGLLPHQNVTVAFGFQPHTFASYQPSLWEKLVRLWFVSLVITGVLSAVVGTWIVIRWARARNRVKEIGTIVPEYIPPKDLSVTAASTVIDLPRATMTAQILDLAVRHYLKVYETKPKSLFKKAEYDLEIVKPIGDLKWEEQELIRDLFDGSVEVGARMSMKTLQKSTAFYTRIQNNAPALTKKVRGEYALREKHAESSQGFKRIGFVLLAIAVLTLSPFLLTDSLMSFIFGAVLWRLSDKGLELRRYLLGLKDYISVAETERIKILQSPEGAAKLGQSIDAASPAQLIKLYERVLPYAVLFGQEKQWSQQLGQYYESANSQPDWYQGTSGFHAANFASTMNSFSSSTSYASPSSSSSSGSGGGGFSGGGGGGGGGGGW